jgi:hypothetical protein
VSSVLSGAAEAGDIEPNMAAAIAAAMSTSAAMRATERKWGVSMGDDLLDRCGLSLRYGPIGY